MATIGEVRSQYRKVSYSQVGFEQVQTGFQYMDSHTRSKFA